MTSRRQQILEVAASLFAQRGSTGVSMHDIGSACGISGPAIYKHFASKDALLTHTLLDISQHLLDGGTERAGNLDELIEFHIDFALNHPDLIVVQEREWSNLDTTAQSAVRTLQRNYIDLWVEAVRSQRHDLDAPTARAAVQATFGLLNSTPHSARISGQAMRALLAPMARAALLG